MPRLMILFGTTDGHTRKIAWALAETIEALGCRADVFNARLSGRQVGPARYDGVMVAASVHAQGYQREVVRWVRRHAVALSRRPTAFVSVSLGVLERRPDTLRDLDGILTRFQRRAGWRPDAVRLVAGALPYTRYSWIKKLVMRRIAARAGGGTDTSRDYDYTDWDDLRAFTRQFAWDHGFAPAPAPALAGAPR